MALGLLEIGVFVFLAFLIPFIFYLIALQNTLEVIRPENRKMEPGMVWLSLIPLFGLIWQFFIVNNLADSLRLELDKKNGPVEELKTVQNLGLAYCILFCCSPIPFLGVLTSIAGIVCWIMFWMKINTFRNMLISKP